MEASKETQRGLEAIRPLEQSEADGATKAAMSILKERAGIDRLFCTAQKSTSRSLPAIKRRRGRFACASERQRPVSSTT